MENPKNSPMQPRKNKIKDRDKELKMSAEIVSYSDKGEREEKKKRMDSVKRQDLGYNDGLGLKKEKKDFKDDRENKERKLREKEKRKDEKEYASKDYNRKDYKEKKDYRDDRGEKKANMSKTKESEKLSKTKKSDKKRKDSISREDFTKIKVLGRGDVGKVYLVRHNKKDKLFAMKVLDKAEMIKRNKVGIHQSF